MTSQIISLIAMEFGKTDKFASYSQKDRYGDDLEIFLKYDRSYMEIRNLQEISPFIRISRQELESIESPPVISQVEGSDNGVDWQRLEGTDIQEGFQIYRLFDPAFILPQSKFELKLESSRYYYYAEGYYDVQELRLPNIVKKLFNENDEKVRKIVIRFRVEEGREKKSYILMEMTQKDFPPFTNTIILTFKNVDQFSVPLSNW